MRGGRSPHSQSRCAIYRLVDGAVNSKRTGIRYLPFTAQELHELPLVISAPRFATYLQAMGNDREKALQLYQWNLEVSSALIVPLQICEVAIRNGVAEAIEQVHGPNWPWTNGFIRSLPRPRRHTDYNPATDLTRCASVLPTTGKIIAELKFAFWEKIFTAGQDQRIWNTHFRTFFPGAPTNRSVADCRAAAHSDLRSIRKLRNRIAHHEPIFTRDIADEYHRIHEMIAWRNAVAASWVDRRQSVLTLIQARP